MPGVIDSGSLDSGSDFKEFVGRLTGKQRRGSDLIGDHGDSQEMQRSILKADVLKGNEREG